jgi:hypothetical protein
MNAATEEVEKIRSVRRKISASCGNDPYRLVAHYLTRAKNSRKQSPDYGQTSRVKESPKDGE